MCAVAKMEASEELCTGTSDVCRWEVERDATQCAEAKRAAQSTKSGKEMKNDKEYWGQMLVRTSFFFFFKEKSF